jgi:hypothetical protein
MNTNNLGVHRKYTSSIVEVLEASAPLDLNAGLLTIRGMSTEASSPNTATIFASPERNICREQMRICPESLEPNVLLFSADSLVKVQSAKSDVISVRSMLYNRFISNRLGDTKRRLFLLILSVQKKC